MPVIEHNRIVQLLWREQDSAASNT